MNEDPRIVELRKFTKDMARSLWFVFPVFAIGLFICPLRVIVWLCIHYLCWTICAIIIWEKTYVGKYR